MIQVVHVSKEIKKSQILDDICLNMHPGQIYGIEGCNGSGKTMLMRMIAGLIFPSSGEILINGKKLNGSGEYPASIGILIENPAFLENLTGLQNLKILASIQNRVKEDEIRQTINDVGLDADDKRKYRKYSLGMKQRLGIAGAIMERPDIILLDEPVNALDREGIDLVRQLIFREKKRGALIILSCHDENFLRSVSDRLYQMEHGKLIADVNGVDI